MRARLIIFSPSVLRELLGIGKVLEASDEELTNNGVSLDLIGMNWLENIDNLPTTKLVSKYKINKFLIHNHDTLTHYSNMSHERKVMLYK